MKRFSWLVIIGLVGAVASADTTAPTAAALLLQQAVTSRSLEKLKDALARGADPRALVDVDGWDAKSNRIVVRIPPLFAVLEWYNIPVAQRADALRALVAAGADPEATAPDGRTLAGAVISAISVSYTVNGKPIVSDADKLALVAAVLDIGADPDEGNPYTYISNGKEVATTVAPLLRLESYSSIPVGLKADVIRLFGAHGADPRPRWPWGDTALGRLLEYGKEELAPLAAAYLDGGLDPDADELKALLDYVASSRFAGTYELASRIISASSHLADFGEFDAAFIHSVAGFSGSSEAAVIPLVGLYATTKGADLSLPDGYGRTPFMLAVVKNHTGIARELVRLGVDPRKPGPTGGTALHGITDGWLKVEEAVALVDFVLGYGVDVNARDSVGRTALAVAAESDSWLDLVKHLVAKGADPGIPDIDGCTAMGAAKNRGNTKTAAYLDTLKVPSYSGGWPVGNAAAACKAVISADPAAVKNLAAADFTQMVARTSDGVPSTPLHLAVETGSVAMVAALAAKAVDWNAGDRYGRTPLELAVTQGRTEIVKALLAAGADPNRRANRGETPYSRAIASGSPLLDLLLASSRAPEWRSISASLVLAGSLDLVKKISPYAAWESGDHELAAMVGRVDILELLGERVKGATKGRAALVEEAQAARQDIATWEAEAAQPLEVPPSATRNKPGSYLLTLGGWSPWMEGDPALELAKYPVAVYVPKGYDGSRPYGLIISMMNAKSSSQYPKPEYVASIDRHQCLYVGFDPYNGVFENGSKEYFDTNHERFCLAVAYAMLGSYNIDRNRVYLCGFSWGGRLTGEIVPKQPRVFTGGIAVGGCFITGGRLMPGLPYARRRIAMVLDTGDWDYNRQETYNGYATFLTLGYEAWYLQEPRVAHARISGPNFEKALTLLDEAMRRKRGP